MSFMMWAIMRTVVVLPLVPVTATIGMRAGAARREEHVDDRPGDVLRLALGGVGVHAEAGRGVDLDDRAAGLAHGRAMSGEMKSMPATSSPTTWAAVSAISTLSGWARRAVDRGAAGAHVAGQRELDAGALGRHIVEREALLADELLGCVVEP